MWSPRSGRLSFGALGAVVLTVALILLGTILSPGDARAQDELIVTNFNGNSVTVYPRTASGNVTPIRTLTGVATGLNAPLGVAEDLVHGELFVANNFGLSVTVYPVTADGNVAPLRTLTGFAFGPVQVLVDVVHDELYVLGVSVLQVFPRTASGQPTPLRTLMGAFTGLAGASSMALDLVNDELVIVNSASNAVTVFARTASGNTAPLRTIQGVLTSLNFAKGLTLDLVNDEIFVTNQTSFTVTVYDRTQSGNLPPKRTLQGAATGLNFPIGLALDLVHDEIVVANFQGSVNVYPRASSGNQPPLRTIAGFATGLASPEFLALSTSAPLLAAVLPLSRSHQVGTFLTVFATIINAGPGPVQQCLIAPPANAPAGLGPFVFQITNPRTNVAVGRPDTPANIAAGGQQTFAFGFTPIAVIPETSLTMNFLCENTVPAQGIPGVNDLTLVTDSQPVPDTIALVATVSGDGVVRIPSATGRQVFVIGTANVGSTGTITVSADTDGQALPITVTVCETNAAGNCLTAPAASTTVQYMAGTTRSFAFFAAANGSIPFSPGVNRVFARLRDPGGTTRGSTSAAVCTAPNAGC